MAIQENDYRYEDFNDDTAYYNPSSTQTTSTSNTISTVDDGADPELQKYVLDIQPVSSTVTFRKYAFKSFYHPYVNRMIKQLNRYGIDGLLDPKPDTEIGAELLRQHGDDGAFDFNALYQPEKNLVDDLHPIEGFDFDFDSPYGVYNWELFFHAPLYIANKLTQNQKFEEAQKWLHYIFNPTESTAEDKDGQFIPAPQRFWKVKPFFKQEQEDSVSQILHLMMTGDEAFNRQLDQWMKNPFQPHVIARLRTVAYMKSVVMKYIDNLIQWGDYLFKRDTIESLNEATQLYVLASQILGKKPTAVAKKASSSQTVEDIMNESGDFQDKIIDMEGELGSIETDHEVDLGKGINGLASMLYFCSAPNEKLLGYWDTVADRLFKIRHCMNIDGVTRSLALFEPPIDPALLVKASAAGLSIGAVLGNLSGANRPHYRFRVLIQKANEICNDVKSLGQTLLSIIEKKDAEELSLLRSSQEVNLLQAVRQIKEQSIEENKENLDSLSLAKELSLLRQQYYSSREYMNQSEEEQLKRMDKSIGFQLGSQITSSLASVMALFPNLKLGAAGISSPFITAESGGDHLYNGLQGASTVLSTLSQIESHKATKAGIKGGYDRRMEDWELQTSLAAIEIEQTDKQITASEIRLAVSERDLVNHDMQIEQSKEIQAFMKNKYTNRDLYNWMLTQVSGMYFQSFQLANDVARMAEQAFGYELAQENPNFIAYGHWDSLKKGLLAGEKLQADLRRMEVAYLEQNKREFELVKHVPLSQLSPSQLINLRTTGKCDIYVPEVMFDMDHPGHYLRRIKSVSITIPCVTGPYTNVNAKLTLTSNKTRIHSKNPESYGDMNEADVKTDVSGTQSIAISSAQNDSGVFELNFQDERYLPFEGAGAVSQWHLEMTNSFKTFDYETISDVILHIKYTARDGGNRLKEAAVENIEAGLNKLTNQLIGSDTSLQRVFSLKTHFPNALHELLQPTATLNTQETSFELSMQHFPHFLSDTDITLVNKTHLLIQPKDDSTVLTSIKLNLWQDDSSLGDTNIIDDPNVLPHPYREYTGANSPVTNWKITAFINAMEEELSPLLNSTNIEDIYLVLNYQVS